MRSLSKWLSATLFLCITIIWLPTSLQAQTAAKETAAQTGGVTPRITVVAVNVGKKLSDVDESMFYGYHDGTLIDIILSTPGKTIIGWDPSRSTVSNFQDDTGKDLIHSFRNADGSLPHWNWDGFADFSDSPRDRNISDDKFEFGFNIYTPDLPDPNAANVHLQATVTLRLGSALTTEVFPNVKLQDGTSLLLGPLRINLKRPSEKNNTKTQTYIILSGRFLDMITRVAFLDPSGKTLLNAAPSVFTWTDNTNTGDNAAFTLPKKLTKATMKVTYYSAIDVVPAVINVTAGVGIK